MENTIVPVKNLIIEGVDGRGRIMQFEPSAVIHVDNKYMSNILKHPIRFVGEIGISGPLVIVNRLTKWTGILSIAPFGSYWYMHKRKQ